MFKFNRLCVLQRKSCTQLRSKVALQSRFTTTSGVLVDVTVDRTVFGQVANNRLQSGSAHVINVDAGCRGSIHHNELFTSSSSAVEVSEGSAGVTVEENETKASGAHSSDSAHVQDWHLENPGPRPYVKGPSSPRVLHPPQPRFTTLDRVVVPSNVVADSKLCTLL